MAGETVNRFEKIGFGFVKPNADHDVADKGWIGVHALRSSMREANMRTWIALSVLLLAGCAGDMVKVAEPASVAVYWFRVNPVCGIAEPECASTVEIGRAHV